jgi:hypothetical protein
MALAFFLVGAVIAQQTHFPRTEVFDFLNGTQTAGGWRNQPLPATQTIATTDTIAADACGTIKRITAASAIGTNTTNTFTAPGTLNTGCTMWVCNVGGTNTITLDKNALFLTTSGADVALLANSCIAVGSDGAIWRQLSAIQTST